MTRLALASAGAFFCVLTMGWALGAKAQQRSVDNHGNWVVNFKSQTPRAQSDRPRRTRSARNKAPAKDREDTLVRFADTEGRVRATFEILTATGWSPHESQQKPLKPGSAKTRLADALGTKERSSGDKADPI